MPQTDEIDLLLAGAGLTRDELRKLRILDDEVIVILADFRKLRLPRGVSPEELAAEPEELPPAGLEGMTKAALQELASQWRITTTTRMTKAQLISAIRAYQSLEEEV